MEHANTHINDTRIRTKLWIAVMAMVVVLVSVIGFSQYRASQSMRESEEVMQKVNERVTLANRWLLLTDQNTARLKGIILANQSPELDKLFKADSAKTSKDIGTTIQAIEALGMDDEDKAIMKQATQARQALLDMRLRAFAAKENGDQYEAQAVFERDFGPANSAMIGSIQAFIKLQEDRVAKTKANIESQRVQSFAVLVGVGAVMVVLMLLGARSLIHSISEPLGRANELAARIAQGDLSVRVNVDRKDEFGELLQSLKAMSDSLGTTVAQVLRSTDSISTASAEIAAGNNDLSKRTEQTSSDLQQTASSMAQLTESVQQSVDNARQASQLAATASEVASQGGHKVHQVVSTMQEINTSSQKIADIIGVIDGIAFQTNILALNAAVEAARAGEQGRGFAVVAGEVRTLAQRSAQAAKEIKALIDASVAKVGQGSALVSDAGATMSEIVESVQRVNAMIGEIAAASSAQSHEIAEVNRAVGNLDQMTQQNAALVEESAAAAQSLSDQADQLAQVVSTFKMATQQMTHVALGVRAPVRALAAA